MSCLQLVAMPPGSCKNTYCHVMLKRNKYELFLYFSRLFDWQTEKWHVPTSLLSLSGRRSSCHLNGATCHQTELGCVISGAAEYQSPANTGTQKCCMYKASVKFCTFMKLAPFVYPANPFSFHDFFKASQLRTLHGLKLRKLHLYNLPHALWCNRHRMKIYIDSMW